MNVICQIAPDAITIDNGKLKLELAQNSFMAKLSVADTRQIHCFAAGGDCAVLDQQDDLPGFSAWEVVEQSSEKTVVKRDLQSPVWQQKTVFFEVNQQYIRLYYQLLTDKVQHLDSVRFARLCCKNTEYGMAGYFDEILNTAINFQERRYYHPCDRFRITFGNDFGPNVGSQALASPVPVMALHDRRDTAYLGVGALAAAGENDWDDFYWNPPPVIPQTLYEGDDLYGGGWSLNYYGKKIIPPGMWQSPSLFLAFAENEEQVLPTLLDCFYQSKMLAKPVKRSYEPWWNTPIYCTWHDQTSYCRNFHADKSAADFCTQDLTEEWLNELEAHDCHPGIVILDAKWQKSLNSADPDPEKWYSFRNWVESCHQRNIKVFLWNLAWTTEDLPLDECITDADGKAVGCDVTNEKFRMRYREMIRRYFSDAPDSLNCDGIKLDGQLNVPIGPGLKNTGNIWGLELQKEYMRLLYETAKAVKKDVCISTFCANPYLDEYSDMVRIADMYASRPTPHESMLLRAKVFNLTMPNSLIDTDGQINQHLGDDDYAAELLEQGKIGIPSLYNAKWVCRWRFFLPMEQGRLSDEDYLLISQAFKNHQQ